MNSENLYTIIHPDAQIGENVKIGPFTSIAADVIIGDNTWIGPHVTIMDGVRIGKGCRIFPGAIVGSIPQDLKFENEQSTLEIGDFVTVREYCTLNRGTIANRRTLIMNHALLMAYVHIAHDCVVGEHCILANNVNLAGHVEVGKYAILGGLTAVHQFVKIGDHAMVSGGSLVRKDIPPFIKAAREPLAYAGVNTIGLRRRKFTDQQVKEIEDIYRLLYVKGSNISKSRKMIETQFPDSEVRNVILDFIENSSRGLIRGYKKN